jgi:hypothetical protein
MLSLFSPNMRSPNDKSHHWYKNFYDIFWVSQLTNNLFLSYMSNFVEDDTQNFSITQEDSVSQCLKFIIQRISENNETMKHNLSCIGISDETSRDAKINLKSLENLMPNESWYDTMRGLLNLWEFLFLFSSFESAMKIALKAERLKGGHIISAVRARIEIPSSIVYIEQIENNIWPFFNEVRNLYSHSHGVVGTADVAELITKMDLAREFIDDPAAGMDEQFDEMSESTTDYTVSRLIENSFFSEGTFDSDRVIDGKFFFLKDSELNVFRNLIADISDCVDRSSPEGD